ncbi:MAG: hypothetical protein DI598_07300 [Pseudopedobacter saltans]|uniref:Uncharacterized protein n=1 Tax=Pseudopedobacter saltans TaxID=151895 RepID=A0A2W5GUX2_9SPHI|nr:MAG: hypothetical protein DI598_07300 [Pseudopedobacter saltans]
MKKRILSILMVSLIVANVNASGIDNKEKGKTNEKVENSDVAKGATVKFIGEAKDNAIVFDVDFDNPTGKNFLLEISNSQGDDLYSQTFSGVNFHKTIMIRKDSDAAGKVKFSLKNRGNDIYSKSFSIDTETRVLRNVVVKSVN